MKSTVCFGRISHPHLNAIWAAARDGGLVAVAIDQPQTTLIGTIQRFIPNAQPVRDDDAVRPILNALTAYFDDATKPFDIPIDWSILKPFQADALRAVCAIPAGETRSYGDIAQTLGQPGAARAVGHANATNPMPIIIPCHRVIGSDGKLHGYSGGNGLETKRWLLAHEGVEIGRQMSLF